jgi:uncharacterized membrane protein YkvA (DUF1232 family)
MPSKKKIDELVIEPEIVQDVSDEEFEEVKQEIFVDTGEKKLQFYEKLRDSLQKKMPKKGAFSKITDYIFLLPDFFILLCRLLMDNRVTNKTKGFILAVIAYVMLPIDIIPDFVPVIGFLDDMILVVFALDQILKYTDEDILLENWSGKADLLLTVRNILDIVDQAVSQRLLYKIKGFLHKIKIG